MNVSILRLREMSRRKMLLKCWGVGAGGVEGIPISVAQAQVQKKETGDLVQG